MARVVSIAGSCLSSHKEPLIAGISFRGTAGICKEESNAVALLLLSVNGSKSVPSLVLKSCFGEESVSNTLNTGNV